MALEPVFRGPEDPRGLVADFQNPTPNPKDPAAQQVYDLMVRGNFRLERKDYDGTISDLKAAIALSPRDYPHARASLADLYRNLNRLDESESLYREAYPVWKDSILFIEGFELLLTKQGKFDLAQKLTNRVYGLEKIYRKQ